MSDLHDDDQPNADAVDDEAAVDTGADEPEANDDVAEADEAEAAHDEAEPGTQAEANTETETDDDEANDDVAEAEADDDETDTTTEAAEADDDVAEAEANDDETEAEAEANDDETEAEADDDDTDTATEAADDDVAEANDDDTDTDDDVAADEDTDDNNVSGDPQADSDGSVDRIEEILARMSLQIAQLSEAGEPLNNGSQTHIPLHAELPSPSPADPVAAPQALVARRSDLDGGPGERGEVEVLAPHAWSAQAVAEADAARRQAIEDRRIRNRIRNLFRRRSVALGEPRRVSMSVPSLIAILVATLAVGLLLTRDNGDTVVQPLVVDDQDAALGIGGAAPGAPVVGGAAIVAVQPVDPLAPRICPLPSERTGETDDLYNGTDPNRNLLPYSPFRLINFPCANFPAEMRATVLYRAAIVLLQAGNVVRSIPFDASATVSLPEVVAAVNDPDWMTEVAQGVFQLDTALVQLGTTSLTITAPEVSEVRFTDRRDVFLGGRGATALIEGVTITSWNADRGGPDQNSDDGRAFILYERGSRLDIIDSRIEWLGSDRSGAYGTSWRTGGTTGSTINTVYDNNWFGVYTFEARDIVFRGNTFSNNVYYGLDPHDYSYGLIVEDNVAFGNGSHGLIFSRGVVDSVMRNNHSYDNGGNGIVLDLVSDRNLIENNLVENNKKDGIVLLASGDSQVINNTIHGNRTGIRLNQVGTTNVVVEGNVMDANRVGIHAYGGASGIEIDDNKIYNSSRAAIVSDAGGVSISNVEIAGAPVGVDARSATDVEASRINDVDTGVVARDNGVVELRSSQIDAADVGVHLFEGTQLTLGSSSSLDAPTEVLVPTKPQKWKTYLPFIGLGIIAVAVVLEIVRGARTAGERYRLAPPGVVNIQ